MVGSDGCYECGLFSGAVCKHGFNVHRGDGDPSTCGCQHVYERYTYVDANQDIEDSRKSEQHYQNLGTYAQVPTDRNAPGEGGWYSRFTPQPIEVIEQWGLDHHRATILQYLVRSDAKGGVEDLEKARWYLDRLIDLESRGVDGPAVSAVQPPPEAPPSL